MAIPPSDKIPTTKLYRTQYLRQSVDNCTGYSIRSKKTTDGIIYYIHYLYFRAQNNGSWYAPLEFNFTEDVPFYLDAAAGSGAVDLYVYVNGQQYTFTKAAGYQVQCAMASYSPYIDATWPFTTSTIPPLYDPAYTDTEVTPIVINKLTQLQYESITPDNTQLYLVTDANFETTNHKVQTIDANNTNTQYPSATAINDVKYRGEPFYIEADGGAISFAISGTMPSKHIAYSFDKVTWTDTTIQNLTVDIPSTRRVYFRSNDTTNLAIDVGERAFTGYAQFSISDDYTYKVGGRLDSLFNYASAGDTFMLFQQPSLITNAEDLDVNHEGTACICHGMFQGAYMLEKAPALSATTLQPYAYSNMFADCASLKEAPALPAETLLPFCYEAMFTYCTSLRFAPPIMAKTLAACCCLNMFSGCSSLDTAPELYATTMVSNCYASMFSGCTNLKQIPRLYATELAASCYSNMFYRCTSLELQQTADGTHYNIVKIPEKPQYDWTLTWNNSMITAPNGTAIFNDTLVTGEESPVFPTPLYALPSATTFNGSSTYIDTGVQLLSTDQDFTIFVDFQYNSQTSMMTVFHCINEASPYPGILLDVNNSYFRAVYYGEKNIAAYDTSRHKIIFTHSAGTTTSCLIYFDSTTGVTNTVDRAYSNVSQNVLLGCYQNTSGNKGRWFNGTIYDARIYNTVLSSTQIGYLMSSGGDWTVRGATLTGLTFGSNGLNYDGISIDRAGNMYYGYGDSYAEVYYASTGWVNTAYKTLTISNDPNDFEDKFINSGTPINLYDPTTITTGYYINSSGVKTTGPAASISDYIPVTPGHNYTWTGVAMESGTNNKRVAGYATTQTTKGTVINNVAVTGTNIPYENTFTVPNGLNYVRLSFNTVDTDIVLVDNDATGENAWGTFKDTNLTISYAWDSRGLSITGMDFKSNNTDYIALLVDNEGNISYGIKPYYIYARSGGNYLKDMPIFKDVFKVVIYSQNHEGSILYTWTGEPSEVQGNDWNGQNNHLLVNGVSVWGRYAGIIGWDIYSWNSNSSNGSGYNTQTTQYTVSDVYTSANGWTNSNYKILTSSYNLSQHFTGTNWSSFFATNKNTNTSTAITVPSGALTSMFSNTGGAWTGTPVINKAYFTDAVLIPEANMSQTDAGYAEIWWADIIVASGLNTLYTLPSTTVFNGSSTYIDTGIQLCDSDKSFTFFVDFQYANKSQYMPVMHDLKEQSPYPGVQITLSSDQTKIRMQYYGETAIANYDTNRHKAIITHEAGTQRDGMFYFDNIVQAAPKTIAYSNFSQNMLLGCYQNISGVRGRYFNGTIYDCIVLDRVATSSEISSLLAGTIPSTFNWSVKNQILSVKFMCNGTLYNKLKIDSNGSMYYGQGNVYTIVYNVNTNTWTDTVYKKIQAISSISSTFINDWEAFLSQSKL